MTEGAIGGGQKSSRALLRRAGVSARNLVAGAALGFLTLSIFSTDAALPVGFNASYLYTLVIMAVALWRVRWLVIATAGLTLALALLAFLIKDHEATGVPFNLTVTSRVASMIVIALTGLVMTIFVWRGRELSSLGTALEEAEGERATTRHMVAAVQRVADIGTWSFDYNSEGRIDWSDEVAAIHGRPSGYRPTSEEALAHYDAADGERIAAAIAAASATGESFMEEARITAADGTPRVVLVMGHVQLTRSGRPQFLQGVIQDVTLWRDAESAIANQRRRFNRLASSMPIIVWTAGADGMVDYFSEFAERYSGRDAETMIGEGWPQLVHPDDLEGLWTRWSEAMASGENYEFEFRIRRNDGQYRWHHSSAQPERGADGSVVRWWGCAVDVHDARTLQDEASQMSAERQLILESITDGVYSLDREWRFRYLNPSAEVLVNRTAEELIGTSVWEEFPEVIGTDLHDIYHRAMSDRTIEHLTNYNPVLDKHFDIIVSPSDTGLTVFFRDTTEVRNLIEQLAHAQRLESVGRLTGGIAHDFNNLLTVVVGGAEAVEADPDLSEDSREMIDLVLQASRRGAELTHRLLAFARRQPLQPKPTDISAQLSSVLPLLKRTIGESIIVETMFGENLPLATVDPGQLENALLNLAINARDAMPGGGVLTLESEAVHLDQTYATAHGDVSPGDYVVVAVTDTGTGIEADVLPRLFDPFFTTKELGQGSGLGLPMVWGFVKQSGGHVSVYSELGQGTTFKLYLPLADASAMADTGPAPVDKGPTRGTGTILLAEDDPLVQRFAAEKLRAAGYTVVVASSGPEALDVLAGLDRIDLLFTDVIMPGGMTGRDLAEAVVERRPRTPVLYSSGYTENVIVHNGRLDAGVALLAKPYSGRQLVQRVHEVIAAGKEVPA